MTKPDKFRISSFLKDIIGRDLVTNEYVAIFELVKNAFDAAATRVDIEFDPGAEKIIIVDDGHGMSANDIRTKWLFVAHSEKAVAVTDDYRDKIRPGGQLAGNKGIGRFACDTLGQNLELYSKGSHTAELSMLKVDWTLFEANSQKEFQEIDVDLKPASKFPRTKIAPPPKKTGTVLVIKNTRHLWDEARIQRLRSDLAKLIDPFGTTKDVTVSTWLVNSQSDNSDINGPVGNQIADLLTDKTSRIEVRIADQEIETTLFDRGRKIYQITEPSPYEELIGSKVEGQVYFLNRAAKNTFTRRMGVRPVVFGSLFLFLNGFRVFPIGEETDDSFGLSRRKQQGQSRYLGTRDVIGRIDVLAPPKMFREVSSRDSGLVEDARSRSLFEAIRKHMVFRLERYVVGVNWKDKLDQERETPEGLESDSARDRILDVVGNLNRSKEVEILYYDEELIRVADDPDLITEKTLKTMTEIAERRGDVSLLEQVESARRRIEELKKSREEARKEAQRAIEERVRADALIERLEQQAEFLGSSQDVDVERMQLLMHQAIIHSGHLRAAIENASFEAKKILEYSNRPEEEIQRSDIEDIMSAVRQSARRVAASLAGANLSGNRLRSVLSFAQNIRVDLETDSVSGDFLKFIQEYLQLRVTGVRGMPDVKYDAPEFTLEREFSPVDVAVLLDNLVDNSRKARAESIEFKVKRKGKNSIVINVTDDGLGIDERKVDASRIFEQGYSGSQQGTGLGLYNATKIVDELDGSISLVGDGSRAEFDIVIPGEVT